MNAISKQIRRCHFYPDTETLITERALALGTIANATIAANGVFKIVLAGGRTPIKLYQQLVSLDTDWSRWIIYFGDERCLPHGDSERNDTMARAAWLNQVTIPSVQIHAMPGELGPDVGALAYLDLLKNAGKFDLVLLGLGEDGHTASLFPLHFSQEKFVTSDNATIAVHDAPKPPPQRISLSPQRLSDAERVWFLVTGADKKAALIRWLDNQPSAANLIVPANLITPTNGVDIFTELKL